MGGNQVLKNPLGGLQEGVRWQQQQKVLQRLAYIIWIDPKNLNLIKTGSITEDCVRYRTAGVYLAVLWIRDILGGIRIRGNTNDLRIRILLYSSMADNMPKKIVFFKSFFAYTF